MKRTLSIYGAYIGDSYGDFWEGAFAKPKNYKDALDIDAKRAFYTDDTIMTCAVAKCFLDEEEPTLTGLYENAVKNMRAIGREFPSGYGGAFSRWIYEDDPKPYNSWGNGASMRISSVGLASKRSEDVLGNVLAVTSPTHNHAYAIYFATLVSKIIFMAKDGYGMYEIKAFLSLHKDVIEGRRVNDLLNFDIERLHKTYTFNQTSHDTVPQAIYAFVSSSSFADCLARALYIGGDSDTLSAIACSMAAPYYGDEQVKPFLDKLPKLPKELDDILQVFSKKYLC